MNHQDLDKHISCVYNANAEHLWQKYPSFAVYRHKKGRKWFAVIMELPRVKLGLSGEGTVNVVNLKCDPLLIGSLLQEKGIIRGYHMNKTHWITVLLDGTVHDDKIKWLLDISFKLTGGKQ